jgi:hypothetical protein
VRLEVALARVELGRPPVERVLERSGPLGGARVGGRGLAVPEVRRARGVGVPAIGGGEPPAVQRGSRDEADCQNGRRDHDFHGLSSPREPGWRPVQTVFFRGSWGGRPASRAVEPGRRWLAAAKAALQVRWRCAEWMGVDGRARPGEAFILVASRLKLPITEIR